MRTGGGVRACGAGGCNPLPEQGWPMFWLQHDGRSKKPPKTTFFVLFPESSISSSFFRPCLWTKKGHKDTCSNASFPLGPSTSTRSGDGVFIVSVKSPIGTMQFVQFIDSKQPAFNIHFSLVVGKMPLLDAARATSPGCGSCSTAA